MNEVRDVLDTAEAAALLRLHPNTLYGLAKAGKVPCRRLGRQLRFSRSALLSWLERKGEVDGDQTIRLVGGRGR